MGLSERAKALLDSPSAIVEGHKRCAEDPYHSEDNPNGYLNFGTAENHLVSDLLLEKLNQKIELNDSHIQYNQLHGSDKLLEALASFSDKYLNISNLSPENFTVQTGLSAVCESLSFTMFDAGDLLMIPTPYYPGFDYDFKMRFKVNFLEVDLKSENNFKHDISLFEKAYDECTEKNKVKSILLTHPHNPTGEILSRKFMIDIVGFAKKNNLSIITDEIYALSTPEESQHRSIFPIADNAGVECHFLYGMAKDFSLAGLKVGFHYSNNTEINEFMQAISYFHPVSSQTCELVANILEDDSFLLNLIKTNRQRLAKTKSLFLKNLEHLSFISQDGALFVMWDARFWCKTFEDEAELQRRLLDEMKINFIAGKDLGLKEPGFFRVCFSRSDKEVLELAKRLKELK